MLEKIEDRITLITQQLQQAANQLPALTGNVEKMKDHIAQLTGHMNELTYIRDEFKKLEPSSSGSDEIRLDIP